MTTLVASCGYCETRLSMNVLICKHEHTNTRNETAVRFKRRRAPHLSQRAVVVEERGRSGRVGRGEEVGAAESLELANTRGVRELLIDQRLNVGDPDVEVDLVRGQVSLDSLREKTHNQLLLLLLRGQRDRLQGRKTD